MSWASFQLQINIHIGSYSILGVVSGSILILKRKLFCQIYTTDIQYLVLQCFIFVKEAKYCSGDTLCGKDPRGNLNSWQLWYKKMYFAFIDGFIFLLKERKKRIRIHCRQKLFSRTGPPVVISSKLTPHLQALFKRNTEKTFSYIIQCNNFLQMGYFEYKTKFLHPQCKFWIGYSALLFCTVELSDGNNEAEHKNIMTFGRDLFLQHVLFTDQLRVGSMLVKCHQINGISSNWQNNEGVCSSAYLEGNFSEAERRHITRAPATQEKAC